MITRQEISRFYGINRKTLYRRIKRYGLKIPNNKWLSLTELEELEKEFPPIIKHLNR